MPTMVCKSIDLKLLVHVIRMNDSRKSKKTLNLKPESERNPERPKP